MNSFWKENVSNAVTTAWTHKLKFAKEHKMNRYLQETTMLDFSNPNIQTFRKAFDELQCKENKSGRYSLTFDLT